MYVEVFMCGYSKGLIHQNKIDADRIIFKIESTAITGSLFLKSILQLALYYFINIGELGVVKVPTYDYLM